MSELLKELEILRQESKEYLEEFLKDSEQAREHYPTIEEYDNCVSSIDELFSARIYDLAIYNLTSRLINEYKIK
tara:strand:- start:567 stop:788 length:222 start_codon:yes stop_codon:yes gene_type:complete